MASPPSPDELKAAYAKSQAAWAKMSDKEKQQFTLNNPLTGTNYQRLNELGEAKGGKVKKVVGPKVGKDDGVVPLKKGEFVVRKSSADKYGAAKMNAVNKGTAKVQSSLRASKKR